MGTTAKSVFWLAVLAAFGLFMSLMYIMVEGSLPAIRRKLIILVWGYGGDIVERISAIVSAGVAGIRSLFALDDEAQEALDW